MSKKYIIDSDFIFGFLNPSDSNHHKARQIFKVIDLDNSQVYCSNLVKEESATLFSKRYGHKTIPGLLEFLSEFSTYFIDEKMTDKTWEKFLSIQKKNISFIDCANLTLAEFLKAEILSFDKFYGDSLVSLAQN